MGVQIMGDQMNEEQLRVWAIEMAVKSSIGGEAEGDAGQIIARAEEFLTFVKQQPGSGPATLVVAA